MARGVQMKASRQNDEGQRHAKTIRVACKGTSLHANGVQTAQYHCATSASHSVATLNYIFHLVCPTSYPLLVRSAWGGHLPGQPHPFCLVERLFGIFGTPIFDKCIPLPGECTHRRSQWQRQSSKSNKIRGPKDVQWGEASTVGINHLSSKG